MHKKRAHDFFLRRSVIEIQIKSSIYKISIDVLLLKLGSSLIQLEKSRTREESPLID